MRKKNNVLEIKLKLLSLNKSSVMIGRNERRIKMHHIGKYDFVDILKKKCCI